MDYEYIANQLLLLYQAGRPTVEGPDVREIIPWVKEAHATVGRNMYFENYKAENQHTVSEQWLVTYKLPIQVDGNNAIVPDSETGYAKVLLVEDYLNLPKNRGIVRVVVADPNYKCANPQLPYIQFENYENLKNGQMIQFAGKFFYSVNNKKVFIITACKEPIPFRTLSVTTAVANSATVNDGMTMLIVQQLLPLMNQRFGRKADMVTDYNPNAS
jgi:hypothetical protein